jgi:hypothetical protein
MGLVRMKRGRMPSRFDLNIQVVPAVEYTGMGFYSFGQTRSLGVRGINKLVNMFAKWLLTPTGTNPINLDEGTQLANLIGSNVTLVDAQEILQVSVTATADAIQNIQAGRGDVPDDERLASVEITQFILIEEAPGFAAQILIRNVANQAMSVVLPTLSVVAP